MRRVPTEIDHFLKSKINLGRSRRYHTHLIHQTPLSKKVILLLEHTYFKPDEKKQKLLVGIFTVSTITNSGLVEIKPYFNNIRCEKSREERGKITGSVNGGCWRFGGWFWLNRRGLFQPGAGPEKAEIVS